MAHCFIFLNLILSLALSLTKSESTSPPLPLNGTFIFTTYTNKNCSETAGMEGYIPTATYWNVSKALNMIIKPINFNPNISRLTYQECGEIAPLNCLKQNEISCLNECTSSLNEKPYYSCNFMPKSNLSLFTFTGFRDSGCNNNNGNVFPLPLTKACWTLEGNRSMSIISFIERRMAVNIYSTNTCIGEIIEYNKGFECDQSCIDNPINDLSVYYQCKYTSSSFIQITLLVLMLYFVLLI